LKTKRHSFRTQAILALKNQTLQRALLKAKGKFVDKRRQAIESLPEFEQLRQRAYQIKAHTLNQLDHYLEQFEQQVIQSGGKVHWADTAQTACDLIVQLCQTAQAKRITKGKSMISEEIALNSALIQAGFEVIETDLGEYIIQLAQESPSHLIAPAVHKTKEEITELFLTHHQSYGFHEPMTTIPALVNQARQVLREKFLTAEVGITGANFLIAETGSVVIVTNEGNGDLTASLPRVHIVIASLEKVVPTLEDTTTLLKLLARSATGQEMTTYTTLFTGPKRPEDLDGPTEFHVVLVDNGRSALLNSEFHEILYCIRCGACLNHCPVYMAVGGHAYGWVYPGPIGAILTPLLQGLTASPLAEASTLCNHCETVCPVKIPLPRLLRQLRAKTFEKHLLSRFTRWNLALWAFVVKRPLLYHIITDYLIRLLSGWQRQGVLRDLPFISRWTATRDLLAPQGKTFMVLWKKRQKMKRTLTNKKR